MLSKLSEDIFSIAGKKNTAEFIFTAMSINSKSSYTNNKIKSNDSTNNFSEKKRK